MFSTPSRRAAQAVDQETGTPGTGVSRGPDELLVKAIVDGRVYRSGDSALRDEGIKNPKF